MLRFITGLGLTIILFQPLEMVVKVPEFEVFLDLEHRNVIGVPDVPLKVPIHATIFKGKLFGFFGSRTRIPGTRNSEFDFFSNPLANPDGKKNKQYYVEPGRVGWGKRHRIGFGSVWLVHFPSHLHQLKLEELYLFDVANPDREKELREKYPTDPLNEEGNLSIHSFELRNLHKRLPINSILSPVPEKVPGYGAVPTSRKTCKSYILYAEKKIICAWDSAFEWDNKKKRWVSQPRPELANIEQRLRDLNSGSFQKRNQAFRELRELGSGAVPVLENYLPKVTSVEAQQRVRELIDGFKGAPILFPEDFNYEQFAALFSEDFHFFLRNDDYYFVTASGKVFIAPPKAKNENTRVMKPVWDDAKNPITAVIEDADKNLIWLFTSNTKNGEKSVFFQLNRNPQPREFDRTKLLAVDIRGPARPIMQLLPLIRREPTKG